MNKEAKMDELLKVVRAVINTHDKFTDLIIREGDGDTRVSWYEETNCCDLRHTIKVEDFTSGDACYYDAGMMDEFHFNIYKDLDKLPSIIAENSETLFPEEKTPWQILTSLL